MTPQDFIEWEKKAPGIDFKPVYVDVAGDLVAGVLLSQIVFWHLPGKDSPTKLRTSLDGALWIAKSKAEWFQETRLSEYRFDRAADILLAQKLIHYRVRRFRGNNIIYIRLDVDVFLSQLEAALQNPVLPGLETREKPVWKPKKRRFINP